MTRVRIRVPVMARVRNRVLARVLGSTVVHEFYTPGLSV